MYRESYTPEELSKIFGSLRVKEQKENKDRGFYIEIVPNESADSYSFVGSAKLFFYPSSQRGKTMSHLIITSHRGKGLGDAISKNHLFASVVIQQFGEKNSIRNCNRYGQYIDSPIPIVNLACDWHESRSQRLGGSWIAYNIDNNHSKNVIEFLTFPNSTVRILYLRIEGK